MKHISTKTMDDMDGLFEVSENLVEFLLVGLVAWGHKYPDLAEKYETPAIAGAALGSLVATHMQAIKENDYCPQCAETMFNIGRKFKEKQIEEDDKPKH